MLVKDTFEVAMGEASSKNVSDELDCLLVAPANVLDIIAASGSRTLPKDNEAMLEVIIVEGKSHLCYDLTSMFLQQYLKEAESTDQEGPHAFMCWERGSFSLGLPNFDPEALFATTKVSIRSSHLSHHHLFMAFII